MIKAFKIPLIEGKYRIIDEFDLIDTAKQKIQEREKLAKKYHSIEIGRMTALSIYKALGIDVHTVHALKIKKGEDGFELKTIECIEKDIEKLFFDENVEKTNTFEQYLKGSKEAMIELVEEFLKYELSSDEDDSVKDFIENETFFTTTLFYKQNRIEVDIAKRKFILRKEDKSILKYEAKIVDSTGYHFSFDENELFRFRDVALNEAKKLIDEHYKLAERNAKVEKIIVKKDKHGTIVIFWPDEKVEKEGFIISNDLIGENDLTSKTEASINFFNSCTDATTKEIMVAKKVIRSCLNIKTYTVN